MPPEGVFVNGTIVPEQAAWSNPALALGKGLTVTVKIELFEQAVKVFVPTIVYVVVVKGFAVTVTPDVELKLVPGAQEYEFAPPAVNKVMAPLQIGLLVVDTVTTGEGLIVMLTI